MRLPTAVLISNFEDTMEITQTQSNATVSAPTAQQATSKKEISSDFEIFFAHAYGSNAESRSARPC